MVELDSHVHWMEVILVILCIDEWWIRSIKALQDDTMNYIDSFNKNTRKATQSLQKQIMELAIVVWILTTVIYIT